VTHEKTVFVTKPYLPPLEKMLPYLERIWESRLLSNCGPLHVELENALSDYLGVNHISLFCNGTVSLVTALQALGISGEVITTPFSFVATSHALLWNKLTPVFVDIEQNQLNLDPSKIENAITEKTTAILAVHCYGNPCKVEEIQEIADKYKLKVIYDAAHAFGVKINSKSLLSFGDFSSVSFHATKVFNTFEGGALVCSDAVSKDYIDKLKNFGHEGEETVLAPGINGKMSEFNAAVGIVQLREIDHVIKLRKKVDSTYRAELDGIKGIECVEKKNYVTQNYSYFPILVKQDYPLTRDELYKKLKKIGIYTRKYFYPLITSFPMYSYLPTASPSNLPIATRISNEILCLPIFPDLDLDKVRIITSFIRSHCKT
jgi:dTDP-4-amino-4,6-dideoxygalactose transaminase